MSCFVHQLLEKRFEYLKDGSFYCSRAYQACQNRFMELDTNILYMYKYWSAKRKRLYSNSQLSTWEKTRAHVLWLWKKRHYDAYLHGAGSYQLTLRRLDESAGPQARARTVVAINLATSLKLAGGGKTLFGQFWGHLALLLILQILCNVTNIRPSSWITAGSLCG